MWRHLRFYPLLSYAKIVLECYAPFSRGHHAWQVGKCIFVDLTVHWKAVCSKEYLKPNSCFECRLKSDKDLVWAIFFFATLIDIYITEWKYNSTFKIKQGNQFIVSFILKPALFLEDGLTINCEITQIKKNIYNKTYIKTWNLALLSNFVLVNLHRKSTDPSITSFCLNTTHERCNIVYVGKQN